MKKFLTVAAFMAVGMLSAANLFASSSYDSWRIEPTVGPTIDIHNWGGTQFSMNVKVGKGENWSGLMGFAFGGLNKAQIKIGAAFDYPFYFTFSKSEDFAVGPTADAGMKFGFGNIGTTIDFFNLGFGCRTAYRITDDFGVVADLVHFSMSFVGWASGAGVNSGFRMAYDMQFGIFYLF
ncbi:MAG: hypothetical protein WCQ53_05475 [bacterium]